MSMDFGNSFFSIVNGAKQVIKTANAEKKGDLKQDNDVENPPKTSPAKKDEILVKEVKSAKTEPVNTTFEINPDTNEENADSIEHSAAHKYNCVANVLEAINGYNDTKVRSTSGEKLTEKYLNEHTAFKWDAIDVSAYNGKSIESYLGDGKGNAQENVIITDAGHTYILEGFERNAEGAVIGLKVSDPSGGGEIKSFPLDNIKAGKSVTAFVTVDKANKEVDKNKTDEADGHGRIHDFKSLRGRSGVVNTVDGVKGSESNNVRLLFVAMADPRQKENTKDLIKAINNGDQAAVEKIVKEKLKLDIGSDEIASMIEVFSTDISAMGTDERVTDLVNKVNAFKKGEPGAKITVGDLFLYLQDTSKQYVMPVGKINPEKIHDGKPYFDKKDGEIKIAHVHDGNPKTVTFTKKDGFGSTPMNDFARGIQYSNVDLTNYYSNAIGSKEIAQSMLVNFNNLINGRDGC